MASWNKHRPTGGVRRSDREVDDYWASVKTEEPVPDDLKTLVRQDLKKVWSFARFEEFGENTLIRWATTDKYRLTLEDRIGKVNLSTYKFLCNKPTAFYWLNSAQSTVSSGERKEIPKLVFAALFEEWQREYKKYCEPDIEYGHFFANPVRITPTGPTTIRGIINAHHSLCIQASSLLKQVDSVPQPYSLHPLYHSIIVIIDRRDGFNTRNPEGFISLDRFAQSQSVLMVRTGLEERLSAPISFDSLRPQALALERYDLIEQEIDVIRVSLAAAVQFIVGLEVREDDANSKKQICIPPDPALRPSAPKRFVHGQVFNSPEEWTDAIRAAANSEKQICNPPDPALPPSAPKGFEYGHVCDSPDTWADAVMAAAEEYGYDNVYDTWGSIRRVQSALIGEDFSEMKHFPFSYRWR